MILVWPDADQPDDASVRASLGAVGHDVLVAPWSSGDDDGGRTALLRSVRQAREAMVGRGADPDELIVVGFGSGAVAAAGLARYAKRLGIGLGRVIAVAGMWDEPDPFSGTVLDGVPERVELVPDDDLQGADGGALARLLRAGGAPE